MSKKLADHHLWEAFIKGCKPIAKDSLYYAPALPRLDVENRRGVKAPIASIKGVADIEEQNYKKLEADKVNISRILDLHGYSSEQSYNRLLYFLECAYRDKMRYVLIIIGKGRNNQGYLQSNVPRWLRYSPQIAQYVNAISYASLKHGGQGALYVRLQKNYNL